MRATEAKNVTRSIVIFLLFLGSLFLMSSCAPSGDGAEGDPASTSELPPLTDDVIKERINDAYVRDVPEENGAGDPIFWNFDENEPKEIHVIDKQIDGNRATIVLDITTSSSPGTRNPRQLAGQIRTEWQLETGWVLRRWEIVRTEKYIDEI
jgi:hypothetical protein